MEAKEEERDEAPGDAVMEARDEERDEAPGAVMEARDEERDEAQVRSEEDDFDFSDDFEEEIDPETLMEIALTNVSGNAKGFEADAPVNFKDLESHDKTYETQTVQINALNIEAAMDDQGVREVPGLFDELYWLRQRASGILPSGDASILVFCRRAPSVVCEHQQRLQQDRGQSPRTGCQIENGICSQCSLSISGLCFEKAREGPSKKKTRTSTSEQPRAMGVLSTCQAQELARGIPPAYLGIGLDRLSPAALAFALPRASYRVRLVQPVTRLLKSCMKVVQKVVPEIEFSPALACLVNTPSILTRAGQRLGLELDEFLEDVVFGASVMATLKRRQICAEGHFEDQSAQALCAFEMEVKRLRQAVFTQYLSEEQRRWMSHYSAQPQALALHLLYQHVAHGFATRLQAALKPFNVLHVQGTWCLVDVAEPGSLLEPLREKFPGWEFAAESAVEARTLLRATFPHVRFGRKAETPWRDYGCLRQECLEEILSGKAPTKTRVGEFIVMHLRTNTNVPVDPPNAYERFVDGRWEVYRKDLLVEPIEHLLTAWLSSRSKNVDIARLAKSVVDHVFAKLASLPKLPELDGDTTRQKLLLANDQVYNFETGKTEPLEMEHRMRLVSRLTGAWVPPAHIPDLFDHVKRWLPKVENEQLEDDELGRQIIDIFEQLYEVNRFLKFVKEVFRDWNMVLFVGRVLAVTLSADPRYCMLHYLLGAGASAKDTFIGVLYEVLGELVATLSSKHATSKAESKDYTSPSILSVRFARAVVLSEVQKHRELAAEALKQYSEQGGVPITNRVTFRFMGQLFMTSNHAPSIADPAGGSRRRFCLRVFPRTFERTEVDAELRVAIKQGLFNEIVVRCRIASNHCSGMQPGNHDSAEAGENGGGGEGAGRRDLAQQALRPLPGDALRLVHQRGGDECKGLQECGGPVLWSSRSRSHPASCDRQTGERESRQALPERRARDTDAKPKRLDGRQELSEALDRGRDGDGRGQVGGGLGGRRRMSSVTTSSGEALFGQRMPTLA